MRNYHLTLIAGLLLLSACGKTKQSVAQADPAPTSLQPKLVVGIVVDQMRYDYLYRYWNDYGNDGFKKLLDEGFSCENHHFGYAPTYTGPGHASVYTGTTPSVHGIISNDWYDHVIDTSVYCTSDPNATSVGTLTSAGKMSSHRLVTSTMCEELELFTNSRSKTVGISLKDRGAILPIGGAGDAAYWFTGGTEGNWISSNAYMDALPLWVNEFNTKGYCDDYLAQGWSLKYDPSVYDESLPDNNAHEGAFTGGLRPVFPYDLTALAPANGNYDIIKATPHGNSLTTQFAKAAIAGESMGQDAITDFLALSYSSTDYVGHQFGPQSMEAQDTYLRLDEEIAGLIAYLDENVGKDQYLMFLTADHGAVHVPSYLEKQGVPAGYWNPANMVEDVKAALNENFGINNWVKNYSNDQFFLDRALIDSLEIEREDMEDFIARMVIKYDGVQEAYSATSIRTSVEAKGIRSFFVNGYNQKRSGDVIVILQPGWMKYSTRTGTSHGSPYAYDTHVPFLLYGWKVQAGSTVKRTHIRDIAPTICGLIKIQMPNGTTGNPITAVFTRKKKK